ncbi:hypothetical protein K8U61_22000 [Nocardioides sp. GBK3QG-3]|uniref:Type IV toxin-antitoxin system AbiEi family antitoxin domain-containing protein n=2 Tax=Nocardioides mangrovi TaxID=2874580 RepID=A0ABS7UIY4_9ACTN|nr:hypothetical protein [Nocardioides mangrovi]
MKPTAWKPDDPRRTPVTLRCQYLEQGYSDRSLAIMVRDGTLARPRRGAYVAGDVWRDVDEVGRHSIRARAVLAQARTEVALSHVSGLLEYDAPIWGLGLDDVHLTRADGRIGRPEAGVRQHRGALEEGDVVERNGVPVTSPTRLALEVTTMTDVEAGLCVVNDLLHRGLTTESALAERYQRMSQWPNSLTTDMVLRLADPLIESIGETRAFHLLFRHSLPMPVPQYEVKEANGRVLGRVDFAWPELGVFLEFDGRVKYEKLLKPGQRPSDVVIAEKRREDRIRRATGWRCVRITWSDLEHPARTIEMIRQALFPAGAAA